MNNKCITVIPLLLFPCYSNIQILQLLRAESLAGEIREFQGEMADYNTLMDKVNTDTEVGAILADCAAVSSS